MKRITICTVSFTLIVLSAAAGTVFTREKAGAIWQDGLFLGDGRTGALGYAPSGLEWTVNRNDVFDARVYRTTYEPHDRVMACVATNAGHSVAYLGPLERTRTQGYPDSGEKLTLSLSAALLRIRFWPGLGWSMPSIPPTRQELDVRAGELRESLSSPKMTPEAVSFIERSRDVMAVSLADPNNPGRMAIVELARPDDVRYDALPFAWKDAGGVLVFTQGLPGGGAYAVAISAPSAPAFVGRTAKVNASCGKTFFLAVRTTRDAADPAAAAVAAVRAAERDGFERIRADNRAWWRAFWEKGARAVFADDDRIDTQWNYSLYALASQYGGAPMPALNGLAYGPLDAANGGVGSNCYVHDQNVQIPMMPFFPLNHAEFVSSFVKTYEDALPEIERRTKECFGAEGAYLPLNMNPNGFEHPIADYRYTLCGGAYSGLVLAQAWWYTHDEEILKEVYPLLKKFILFYTSTMTKDADGTYHFIWSVPPEIFTGTKDETAIVACLKPCLEAAVEAATRFGRDAAECALWKDVLAHYPKIAKHSTGSWWCGPDIPDDHYMYGGHLFYPFFPAEADVDVETAKKTLDYHRDYAVEVSYETPEPHPVHDWSALYSGIATVRLHGPERGWKTLQDFHAGFAKPNGLFSHNPIIVTDLTREQIRRNLAKAPPLVRRDYHNRVSRRGRGGPDDLTWSAECKTFVAPVIEGGAAFLLLASETLCQSWGGEIRLFPGVPKGFSGRFENFRVRGGFTVSAEMKNGRVVRFDLRGAKKGDRVKVVCPTDPDFVQLPGEPAWKKPVGHGPFPDALTAFVFRNWSLVPAETLARTIGTDAAAVRRIAAETGLDPEAKVPAEWKRAGYVTVLRRNWQLLPYDQILEVLGMSRKELRHALMYDDFLMTKMGREKPAAARIVWSAEAEAAGRAGRLRAKDIFAEEGVKAADPDEEPRFAFMRRLAEVPASMRGGKVAPGGGRFRRKLIFPYCADYGDVLADPEASSCSEGLIARLAESGVDALWFHVVLAQLSTDPKYPEWSVEAPRRRAALKKLVARAAKYGVKVFLYINEPREQPSAFFDAPGRAGMRGAADRRPGANFNMMCTEDPATLAWLKGCLEDLFRDVAGLGGVFTVTMSETPTHCASGFAESQKKCPKCRDKPWEHFVAQVNRTITDGVKAGNPEAEVWFYDVGWEVEGLDRRVIPLLPKEGSLLVWSEKKLPFEQAGRTRHVTEYSISHPGPSERTLGLWKLAESCGLGSVAKLQVNCSWELSGVPYLPTMDLVAEHACNLAASPVESVMLSWSQGGCPSPNLAVFNEFRRGDDRAAVLDRMAAKLYGAGAAAVRRAWTAYSEAFRNYPIEWQTVYYAPVQMGAANLLYPEKTDWPATMINTPYDDFNAWSQGYADNRRGWIEQMRRCAEGFEEGDRLWREATARCTGEAAARAAREGRFNRAATLTFRTVTDQSEFILARDRGDRAEMKRRATKELATAKEMLGLVRRESALGYEASNRYIYVPNDFLEKILNCRSLLSATDARVAALPEASHDRGGVSFDFAALSDARFSDYYNAPTNILAKPWSGVFDAERGPMMTFPLPHDRGGTFRVSCLSKVVQTNRGDCALMIRLGTASPHFRETPNRFKFAWCDLPRRGDRWCRAVETFEVRPGENHAWMMLHKKHARVELKDLAIWEVSPKINTVPLGVETLFCDVLDGRFEIGAGQVGSLGFACCRRDRSQNFSIRHVTWAFTLPDGIELLDTTCTPRNGITRTRNADGTSTFRFRYDPTRPGFPIVDHVPWHSPHAQFAVLSAREGADGTGRLEAFYDDGKRKTVAVSKPIRFAAVAPVRAPAPRHYANGAFVMQAFDLLDPVAIDRYAEFVAGCGCTWLIPRAATEYGAMDAWRRHGIRFVTPYSGWWCVNGYQVTGGCTPEEDRFVRGGKNVTRMPGPGMTMCPLAVATESDYFRTNVVPLIASNLRGCDGMWANWEPFMFEGRGCFCGRCRNAFAEYVGRTEAEVAVDWPTNVLKGGVWEKEGRVFRSICHGRLVKTIDRYVTAATGGGKSLGFIPGVHFGQMASSWHEKLPMAEAQEIHYAGDLKWINVWGPYLAWDALRPYRRERGKYVGHVVAARDLREQVDADYPPGHRPKLMAAPQGTCGTWLTQPENFEILFDAYFFNRYEANLPWTFPVGADARYWRAFANATARAARYESYVWSGTRADDRTRATPVAEYAAPVRCPLERLPKWRDVPQLLTAAWEKGGARIVAVFNCWQEGEAFFTLACAGMKGRFEIVSDDGVLWAKTADDAAWTAEELAAGVFLSVGAARCRVFEIRPAGGTAASVMTVSCLHGHYAARRSVLAEAAERDRLDAAQESRGVVHDD